MRKNFDKRIDMDELAKEVFLSHSGLIWKFKRELNTTPSKYLGILRLRYAKQLLLNDRVKLVDVALSVGYEDQSYFSKVFRKHTGMTPKQYQKQRGNKLKPHRQ